MARDPQTNYDSRRGVDDRPAGVDDHVRQQHRLAERDARANNDRARRPLLRGTPKAGCDDKNDERGRPKR